MIDIEKMSTEQINHILFEELKKFDISSLEMNMEDNPASIQLLIEKLFKDLESCKGLFGYLAMYLSGTNLVFEGKSAEILIFCKRKKKFHLINGILDLLFLTKQIQYTVLKEDCIIAKIVDNDLVNSLTNIRTTLANAALKDEGKGLEELYKQLNTEESKKFVQQAVEKAMQK